MKKNSYSRLLIFLIVLYSCERIQTNEQDLNQSNILLNKLSSIKFDDTKYIFRLKNYKDSLYGIYSLAISLEVIAQKTELLDKHKLIQVHLEGPDSTKNGNVINSLFEGYNILDFSVTSCGMLKNIPSEIFNNKKIIKLNFIDTSIEHIPKKINNLINLRELTFNNYWINKGIKNINKMVLPNLVFLEIGGIADDRIKGEEILCNLEAPKLKIIHLDNIYNSASVLENLSRFPNLKKIKISKSKIDDSFMKNITKIKNKYSKIDIILVK